MPNVDGYGIGLETKTGVKQSHYSCDQRSLRRQCLHLLWHSLVLYWLNSVKVICVNLHRLGRSNGMVRSLNRSGIVTKGLWKNVEYSKCYRIEHS